MLDCRISPNGRDVTVDFPMQSNWTGLISGNIFILPESWIIPNERDVTVDFPMQSNWTGLISGNIFILPESRIISNRHDVGRLDFHIFLTKDCNKTPFPKAYYSASTLVIEMASIIKHYKI